MLRQCCGIKRFIRTAAEDISVARFVPSLAPIAGTDTDVPLRRMISIVDNGFKVEIIF